MPGLHASALISSSSADILTAHQQHISIDDAALQRLAAELTLEQVRTAAAGTHVFPMRFSSLEEEVNFLALYHLLDFGSGYDALLIHKNRRDADETIQFGCIGMRLGSDNLDANWLKGFSNYSVHNFFGIESMEEQELQPGISISKPGPLHPLTQALRSVINDTGETLDRLHFATLGQYILTNIKTQLASGHQPSATALAQDLAAHFAGFQDQEEYSAGLTAVFLRKAQRLARELQARFGAENAAEFEWADASQLTADSGNLVPAVLHHLGVLQYSGELTAAVEASASGTVAQLAPGPHEIALRAGAVVACDALAARVGHGVSGAQVGAALSEMLNPEGRLHGAKLLKHVTRETLAY